MMEYRSFSGTTEEMVALLNEGWIIYHTGETEAISVEDPVTRLYTRESTGHHCGFVLYREKGRVSYERLDSEGNPLPFEEPS